MKIVHIITSLGEGGAETMLYKLLKYTDRKLYEVEVITMIDRSVMGDKIEELGIKLYELNMKRGIPTIRALIKAARICKDADIIQAWMYHADLLGFIIGKLIFKKRVFFGIRHSNLERDKNKRTTLFIAKINAFLSRYVDKVVSCSEEATRNHIKYGYEKSKFVTIPNGFEIDRYHKVMDAKEILIKELGFDCDYKIICSVGRWNVLKDYNNLLSAVEILSRNRRYVKCLIAGTDIDYKNKELGHLIQEKNLKETIILLGRRNDIPTIMSASDVFVLSSSGEGFPNVIGESMACEVPCVVTNVGDCASIVGELGLVVERKNPLELASAIEKLLDLNVEQRDLLGKKLRKRVIDMFDINYIVKNFEELYK